MADQPRPATGPDNMQTIAMYWRGGALLTIGDLGRVTLDLSTGPIDLMVKEIQPLLDLTDLLAAPSIRDAIHQAAARR